VSIAKVPELPVLISSTTVSSGATTGTERAKKRRSRKK
jgi:hypothetical protein